MPSAMTDAPGAALHWGCRTCWDYQWDLMIAHPPCTDLAVSGARHLSEADGREAAGQCVIFMMLAQAEIPGSPSKLVCIMSSLYRKPD